MAHFAELDDNNIVKQVIVVHNNELLDESGNESEQKGIDFCVAHYGGTWIQTSYNNSIRFNYAGIGYTFDVTRNAFIPPKEFNSWILDEATCRWKTPILMPVQEGKTFTWDEPTLSWVEIVLPA